MKDTTISVSRQFHDWLTSQGKKKESYEDIIKRVVKPEFLKGLKKEAPKKEGKTGSKISLKPKVAEKKTSEKAPKKAKKISKKAKKISAKRAKKKDKKLTPKLETQFHSFSHTVNPDVANYVRTHLKSGFTKDQIKLAFLKRGWNLKDIEEILKNF